VNRADDFGKLLLRVTVGGLMLFHGISKLNRGITGIEKRLTDAGLPAWIGPGVYVGEIVAPALLILGLWTRPAALVIVFNMVMAIYLSHAKDVLKLSERGGAWAIETPMFFLLTAVAVAVLGPGRWSVGGKDS
jgi:putative oxidoreductase